LILIANKETAMSSKVEDDAREFAATRVRAKQVTVGTVTGWQVQKYDGHTSRWVSCNVMCSEEEAHAEVAERREALAKVVAEYML
jgi:hypothetical protein